MTELIEALQEPGGAVRQINVLLSVLVIGGLTHRIIGRWPLSFPLGRVVMVMLGVLELIVAGGTIRAAQRELPLNEAQYALTVHHVVMLAVLVAWPWLAKHYPPTERKHT